MKTIYIRLFLLSAFVCCVLLSNAQFKIQPSVGYGVQAAKYSSDYANISGKTGIEIGANAYYLINADMAVGAGFHMSQYGAKAVFENAGFTDNRTDINGDNYEFTANFNGVNEEYKLPVMEFPVLFRYQHWVTNNILLFGSTGPVFVVPGSMKGKFTSGQIATSGYYPQWNLTVDDVPEYGLYTRDVDGDTREIKTKSTIGYSLEVGAEYFLAKRLNLFFSANFLSAGNIVNSSIGNELMPDVYTFNGSMAGVDKVTLSKMAVRIGVIIDLTPTEKEGIKSIR